MAGGYSWKGPIEFGLIHINVSAKSAVREDKVTFNKHHAACGGRLRQGGMVCEGCGEINITAEDTVRGYGGVAGVDEEYLKALQLARSESISIKAMVPLDQVDPRFFQKSYNVTADKGSERQYALFHRVMTDQKRVAIGEVSFGGKGFPCLFRPRGPIIAMEVLYWHDELVAPVESINAIEGVKVSAKELTLGKQLADQFATDFDPTTFENQYAEELAEYLHSFVEKTEPPKIDKVVRKSPGAQSLEEQLAASLATFGPAKKAKPAKKVA